LLPSKELERLKSIHMPLDLGRACLLIGLDFEPSLLFKDLDQCFRS